MRFGGSGASRRRGGGVPGIRSWPTCWVSPASTRSATSCSSSASSTRAAPATRTWTSTSPRRRREEVIQYVYEKYGAEHTGMVCNLVTYRARSAVREVGYALGFPRPLVDRVAKALETYDSVMVRRDLEAEGGFAEFFQVPGVGSAGPGSSPAAGGSLPQAVAATLATQAAEVAAEQASSRGFVGPMGELNHPRGSRLTIRSKRSTETDGWFGEKTWREPPKQPRLGRCRAPGTWSGARTCASRKAARRAPRGRALHWTRRHASLNFCRASRSARRKSSRPRARGRSSGARGREAGAVDHAAGGSIG